MSSASSPRQLTYYAHTADDAAGNRLPESDWQPLRDHLENVALRAAQFAAPFGLSVEGHLLGLLHDLGKYQDGFQRYLRTGRPRTPHAIHGGAALPCAKRPDLLLLANIIASHHAGLHDVDDNLLANLNRFSTSPEGQILLTALRRAYQLDGLAVPPLPQAKPAPPEGDAAEDVRLRWLLSALVDADYLDTEEHFLRAAGRPRPVPQHDSIPALRDKLDTYLGSLAAQPNPSSLNQLRTRIAARCAEVGRTHSPAAFSLTVPTGGGKTLASAAFALHHAAVHGFQRVIYVIPYTSIIEQNAQVFASIFGRENILEHHSLADWQTGDDAEDDPESYAARAKIAAENWDAPFIVTTNVQFFESLHSHRPSAVRKLHRLIGAVVLFDECQTFPPEILDPSLATLQALHAYGKTSLVFCTATQPAFERREFFPAGFPKLTEIIPAECGADADWRLHARPEFRRTRIRHSATPISLGDLAARIAAHDRVLTIVNTRRTARELFDAVHALSPGPHVYHLSTFMCPAHRHAVLTAIRARLASPEFPCVVIATQLVEAGVDLDFPRVFRVLGPLDAVLQAAGRCNREGRLTDAAGRPMLGEVEVVTLVDATLPPGVYRRATELAAKFLPEHEGGGEITPEAIRQYFRELYHATDRDKHHIDHLRRQRRHREIGLKYRWIDESEPTQSVLTDYDEASRAWIGLLEAQGHQPPSRQQRRAIARLCLNLRDSEAKRGERAGLLRPLACGLLVTQHSYDPRFGYDANGTLNGEHTIF